jgi:hypothetical protein
MKDTTHYCIASTGCVVSIACLEWWGSYAGPDPKAPVFDADFDDSLHTVYCTEDESLVTCPKCLSWIEEW